MKLNLLRAIALALALAIPAARAEFHMFQIEQLYTNSDGTIQFVVLHECCGFDGENFLGGHTLTSTVGSVTKSFTFTSNLPSGATAGARVLIATQGFAAIAQGATVGTTYPPEPPPMDRPPMPAGGPVTPDYVMPDGFLPTGGGTLNYAGVDQLTFGALPTDGVNALFRSGTIGPNLATNFAGTSISVTAPVALSPQVGLWWNPAESGTGYAIDFKHGVLAVAIYSYLAGGSAQWYLAAGPLNGNTFTATLDKYIGGQCISCMYVKPTVVGNDGIVTIVFSSNTAATMSLPGGRVTQIQPTAF